MLHINDLVFRMGGRVLFDGATMTLPKGHKVGLVGLNGAGKTTLFRLIAGEASPDGGNISLSGRARIGRVTQEAPSGPMNLLDTVLAADAEMAALTAEAETATDPHRIADVHTRLADLDAHAAPARAAAILAGLGFDEATQARPCSEFSGGWRMRVALSGVLFSRPDLLLLDEPTNHLDLEATIWLENYLANWPGTMLMISHDRDFLNRTVNGIVHLEGGKLVRYQGNYDRFVRTRNEHLAHQAAQRERQQAERKHIQAFIDRFRAKASKARQAQSRIKMLAKMEPIAGVVEGRTPTFHFPDPSPLPPPIVALDDVIAGYNGHAVLSGLNLRIDMDDRIAILGANGNGKSTLVKILGDRLKPMGGELRKSGKLKVGYFAQHQAEEIDLDETPLTELSRRMGGSNATRLRTHLGRFGFGADKAETRIGDLSGGEKARLLFCLMSIEAPHILLLDEPTNHLDVDAREALAEALNDFEGAVILVSHDVSLIELVCDRLWLVAGGSCAPYDGDLSDYRRFLLDEAKDRRREAKTGESAERTNGKAGRQARALERAQTADLRRRLTEAEKAIEKLGREKDALESRLANPALYEKKSDEA
ncbi:MAG: ABC-F family ATP-binding cassette domain-containing protein, partial [Alphaproteobacteria bacterium]|nr:ABC-F family ATP-binding cassette domain-containing protein [Alphaproteobacteria bacterium]